MKVAIYARVSSERQAEKDLSIPAQIRALKKYALGRDWEVAAEFIDEAESARSTNRPAFKDMINAAKNKVKPFDAILVWKLSRFARNREDSVIFKSLLKRRGISVISMNEQVDETPAGYLLEGIIEVIDEFYSANLAQDTLRGMKENASRGFRNGGSVPFGYKRTSVTTGGAAKSTLIPHEREAPIVKRAFSIAEKGRGAKEVARELNADGLRTRTGKHFGATGINRMLRNEAYIGTLVWNRHSRKSGGRRASTEADVVRVPLSHPPLVAEEVFRQVQDTLTSRRPTVIHPRTVSSQYLLSGIAYCGVCGAKAIGAHAKSGQYFYYHCNNRYKKGNEVCQAPSINAKRLEGFVIERIKENILTEANLKELLDLTNQELADSRRQARNELEGIEESIQEVDLKLGRLYSALEGGKVEIDDLAPRLKELRTEQKALLEKQDAALDQLGQSAPPELNLQKLEDLVAELRVILESSTFLESKAFLRSFIRRVEYTKTDVGIEYTVPVKLGEELIGDKEVLDIRRVGSPERLRTENCSSRTKRANRSGSH